VPSGNRRVVSLRPVLLEWEGGSWFYHLPGSTIEIRMDTQPGPKWRHFCLNISITIHTVTCASTSSLSWLSNIPLYGYPFGLSIQQVMNTWVFIRYSPGFPFWLFFFFFAVLLQYWV
jgi:hypothetical protein